MTESKNRSYYTIEMMLDEHFFQFPKWLVYDPTFSSLSNDAKVLYMFLKDRFRLSAKNRWYDKKGRVFVICSREHMQKLLNKSENTVKKIMNELTDEKISLIEEKRNKQSNNYIYLLMPKFQNYEDSDSEEEIEESFVYENEEDESDSGNKNKNRKKCGSIGKPAETGSKRTAKSENLEDPQNLRTNNNKFFKEESLKSINNNSNSNHFSMEYPSKEELSVFVNKDIPVSDFLIDSEKEAFAYKQEHDYKLYSRYSKKNPYLAKLMNYYAMSHFRNILARLPDTLYTDKAEILLLDTVCSPKFKCRQNTILDLGKEKINELYHIAMNLSDPESDLTITKSRKAYLIGALEIMLEEV